MCSLIQSCLIFCNPIDCRLPGSSVYGILQARILEWVAIPFSRRSSQPRDQTRVSCIAIGYFTARATSCNLRMCLGPFWEVTWFSWVSSIIKDVCMLLRPYLWLNSKESTSQWGRQEFLPWIGNIPWRRKWQPTPIFLGGKSHGQRSLACFSP